jgi:LysR family carnitine catabolism transcriptional activator
VRVNITLQQLEAFVEVAKTSNFRAAAQALHVSQPALSRTIRIVEDLTGARLFDRDTRHVELTPAGRELLPIALRILENFNSSFSELSQFLDGRSGHLTIAALPSIGVALLPKAIRAFRDRHPQVEFSLIEGPAELVRTAVNEGRADFGISVRPGPQEPMLYRHLIDDPFMLLCRRDDPLAHRASVAWSVFATRPFIASGFTSSIRPITDAAFLQRGLQVVPRLEYPSVAAAGALVEAGLGLTALPRLALQMTKNEELVTVPLQRPTMTRPIGLITRAGRSPSPVGRAFMDLLHTAMNKRAET